MRLEQDGGGDYGWTTAPTSETLSCDIPNTALDTIIPVSLGESVVWGEYDLLADDCPDLGGSLCPSVNFRFCQTMNVPNPQIDELGGQLNLVPEPLKPLYQTGRPMIGSRYTFTEAANFDDAQISGYGFQWEFYYFEDGIVIVALNGPKDGLPDDLIEHAPRVSHNGSILFSRERPPEQPYEGELLCFRSEGSALEYLGEWDAEADPANELTEPSTLCSERPHVPPEFSVGALRGLVGSRVDDVGGNVVPGDYNGDGYDDLLLWASDSGVAHVFLGSGTRFKHPFASSELSGVNGFRIVANGQITGVIAADFNGDKRSDIALNSTLFIPGPIVGTGTSSSAVSILLGRASFSPELSTTSSDFSRSATALTAGDFNVDGYSDLIVQNRGIGDSVTDVEILFGAESIATPSSTRLFDSGDTYARNLGDVDGDGGDDLAIADRLLFSSSSGLAAFPQTIDGDAASALGGEPERVGDINGDCRADFLVDGGATKDVYFGRSTFPPSLTSPDIQISHGGDFFDSLDFNGDQLQDIVLGAVIVRGREEFPATLNADTDIGTTQVLNGIPVSAVGDFNQDGKDDLALQRVDFLDATISAHVLLGDADPLPAVDLASSGPHIEITGTATDPDLGIAPAGDLDGDGGPDIALMSMNTATAFVLHGRPNPLLFQAGFEAEDLVTRCP